MNRDCRVLPHVVEDGPANMAMDEALLDSVASGESGAVVRTYEWSSPTLSLGYFQSIALAKAEPRWQDVPWVRRATGGGALWHDREITYSVVIPADHPAARPSIALYRAIHQALADRLRTFDVLAERRGPVGQLEESGNRPFLCFTDRDPEDIVFMGQKLVGSAQRRRAGAVLQHGSLLLDRSKATPELPGLTNLAPSPADPLFWSEILRVILPEALDLPLRADHVSNQERRRADSLRTEIYENPSWTYRR